MTLPQMERAKLRSGPPQAAGEPDSPILSHELCYLLLLGVALPPGHSRPELCAGSIHLRARESPRPRHLEASSKFAPYNLWYTFGRGCLNLWCPSPQTCQSILA